MSDERRVMRVGIHGDILTKMMTKGYTNGKAITCIEGLPEGAKLV